jgi:flagellar assembly protein FliH
MSDPLAAKDPDACRRWHVPQLDDANAAYSGGPEYGSKAWEAGFEQGRLEGVEAGRAEVQRQVQYWAGLAQTLVNPFAELDEQVEQQLLQLAMAIAEQLIQRELSIDPALVLGAVRQAMSALPVAARQVCIALRPEDAQLVREQMSALEEGCEIVEDPQLERGGCLVTTNTSRVDATLSTRIGQILAAMLGGQEP